MIPGLKERWQAFKLARAINRPREWVAINPTGRVSLGIIGRPAAIRQVNAMGKISFVDEVEGFIFYDTHAGGPSPSGF